MTTHTSGRWYFTPCGLDCYDWPIRLRTDDELSYWVQQLVDPEKIGCDGCRLDRSKNHWAPDCEIQECSVHKRKDEFCAQCPDFQCQILKDWSKEYEHHAQAVADLKAMKEMGIEQWFEKKGVG